ncbi:UbiA prenyltransferase family protein [Streptomyces triticiradicis]|uniref:UbiA family prenyltransferase n=1 Tax=Streptomyces triticiradicis TaxID=2651189 RepID=A0A7J5DD84_9ACTN|nr:hypothetical protein [Streptomyces triticiradicis]KAB1986472.1 hypothetical protein F8144_22580 [Streptomyces triticiradicis]
MGTPEQSTTGGPEASWADQVGGLAGSCHPGPVVAVTTLMAALAITADQSAAHCVLTAAAVLTGQLSVGWCNDAVDARRDIAAGRRGKPVVDGTVGVTEVWVAAYAALALCVPLSFAGGLWAGAVHLAGVAAAWAYDLRLKATAWSWAPYAVGFAAFPAFVALGPAGPPGRWGVAAPAMAGLVAVAGTVLGRRGQRAAFAAAVAVAVVDVALLLLRGTGIG